MEFSGVFLVYDSPNIVSTISVPAGGAKLSPVKCGFYIWQFCRQLWMMQTMIWCNGCCFWILNSLSILCKNSGVLFQHIQHSLFQDASLIGFMPSATKIFKQNKHYGVLLHEHQLVCTCDINTEPAQRCLTQHHAAKRHWRSGGIAPDILDLGTRWRWVVSFTTRPLYPQGKSPRYPLGGLQGRCGRGGENKNSTKVQSLYVSEMLQKLRHTNKGEKVNCNGGHIL
jgi:hypothetical protein